MDYFNIDFDVFDEEYLDKEESDEEKIDDEVCEINEDENKRQELIKMVEEKSNKMESLNKLKSFKEENDTNLTEKQVQAIDLFINGENKTQIAKKVGVTRATVIKWFKKDEFKKELEEKEKERDVAIYHELISYVPESVGIIKSIIENDLVEPKDRLRAIQMLWDATGFSKKKEQETVKRQTIIAINPEFSPNKTVVNNMVERIIDEDEEDTNKVKENVIDV